MVKRRFSIVVLVVLVVLTACSQNSTNSITQEAPDYANALERFGIDKTFTYDELKNITQVSLQDLPWADVYWPLASKGMAWRWAVTPGLTNDETVKIASFFQHFADEAAKSNPDPLLAPAEKYDLLFAYRYRLNLVTAEFSALDAAFVRQDIALRSESDLKKKREIVKSMREALLASKMAPIMSMTTNSWAAFLEYSADPKYKFLADSDSAGEDWWWMGHCHGWAAAAFMQKAPLHSVMAIIGNQKVFFSEGDLRGLLSKAWADDAPNENSYFLGRRCTASAENSNKPIEANRIGRGISGKVTIDNKETSFIFIESLPILQNYNATVYRIKLEPSGEEKILVEQYRESKPYYWLASSFDEMANAFRSGNLSNLPVVQATITGCWDANPASLHAVLVEQIGSRHQGLAMDRVRSGQIWNQPIYNAVFRIGELKVAGTVDDIAAAYRASGTSYIAEVTTTVQWTTEPGLPELSYSAHFDQDQLTYSDYVYTLEFDEKKRLIGGEWGSFKKLDPAADAPNFLFGFPKDARPEDNMDGLPGELRLDYKGILAKLYDCSIDKSTDSVLKLHNHQLAYKNCTIDRVAP